MASKCSNPHPGVVRFALAPPPDRTLSPPRHIAEVRTSPPQNGKCAAARARKSLAHASEPAGPSRPATRGPPPGLRFPQTRRSVRPFQAPRTRLRLEAAFGGLVLAGRKVRASHRQRSGLKIPPRPLAAPASPALGGARPLLHWPASPLKERAGVPALARYAAFGLPIDSTGTASRIECHLCFHAQLLMDPILSRMNLMRIPAQAPLHALRQIHNRCAVFNPPGARRIRADLAPDGFNTAPVQRAGHRRLMSSAHHQTLRADRRDGSYEPTRRTTRIPLTLHSPGGEDRSRRTAPPQ